MRLNVGRQKMGCGKCPKAHKNPHAGAVDVHSAIYSIDFDLIGPWDSPRCLGLSQVLSQTVRPTPRNGRKAAFRWRGEIT
jgi:hypothetical protein